MIAQHTLETDPYQYQSPTIQEAVLLRGRHLARPKWYGSALWTAKGTDGRREQDHLLSGTEESEDNDQERMSQKQRLCSAWKQHISLTKARMTVARDGSLEDSKSITSFRGRRLLKGGTGFFNSAKF